MSSRKVKKFLIFIKILMGSNLIITDNGLRGVNPRLGRDRCHQKLVTSSAIPQD